MTDNVVKHDLSKITYVIFHTFRRQWLMPFRASVANADIDINWTNRIDDAGSYSFGEARLLMLRFNKHIESTVLMVPEFATEYMKPL